VTVSVNTAGLAPGNYSGFVCLGSNDPARATATVRVNLSVVAATQAEGNKRRTTGSERLRQRVGSMRAGALRQ
jgi:hypothetical protein